MRGDDGKARRGGGDREKGVEGGKAKVERDGLVQLAAGDNLRRRSQPRRRRAQNSQSATERFLSAFPSPRRLIANLARPSSAATKVKNRLIEIR